MQDGQFHACCFTMYGMIYQNEKGELLSVYAIDLGSKPPIMAQNEGILLYKVNIYHKFKQKYSCILILFTIRNTFRTLK